MFSFKGIINKIFKRKAKTQPTPTQSQASQPLSGKRFFGRNKTAGLAVDRGSKHAGGKRKPKNWKAKAKIRRKMAAHSRSINRKQS